MKKTNINYFLITISILLTIITITIALYKQFFILPFFILFFGLIILWTRKNLLLPFVTPALFIMLFLAGFPVLYTIYISFTNTEGETRGNYQEVLTHYLESNLYSVPETPIIHAQLLLPRQKYLEIRKNYQTLKKNQDKLYDTIFQQNLSREKEAIALEKADRKLEQFIHKELNYFSLDNCPILLSEENKETTFLYYPQNAPQLSFLSHHSSHDETNNLPAQSTQSKKRKNYQLISIDENNAELHSHYYLLKKDNPEDIEADMFENLINQINSSVFIFDNKAYYHDYNFIFLQKVPTYYKADDESEDLLQLNTTTLEYSERLFNIKELGRFVSTPKNIQPDFHQVFSIVQPQFIYPWYQPFRTRYVEYFFYGQLNAEGFFDAIKTIFPDEYLEFLETSPITPTIRKELTYKIKLANKEVARINKARFIKNGIADRFKELFYRKIAIFPKLGKFSYKLENWNNFKRIHTPGYQVLKGFKNYQELFQATHMKEYYKKLFLWTVSWTFLSVLFSFLIGFAFALALNKTKIKGLSVYRSLLILPYIISPSISVMMWNTLLNTDHGAINAFLGYAIPWLENPYTAKTIAVVVNVWLSFPYFMIITSGALQSIDPTLYEVAAIDGAKKRHTIWFITLPLVLQITMPLLIGYFAYSFNNFTIIYLLYGKDTKIVISLIYDLAAKGRMFALSSTISVITFVALIPITLLQLKANGSFNRKDKP